LKFTARDDANEWPSALTDNVNDIIGRFEAMSIARDAAVTDGRQVIRLAANTVRALHRGENDAAAGLLAQARTLLDSIRQRTAPYPNLYWAGYVQDAMKEYAEAEITAALLQGTPIPAAGDLRVEDAAWLNALAEAGSELRRGNGRHLRRARYG
jgi:translin